MTRGASSRRRGSGELEALVLRSLWRLDSWATPALVLDAIPDPLAHTTVVTVLRRLHQKGELDRRAVGRTHEYRPRLTSEERTAGAMAEILRAADDPALALNHFVAGLDVGNRSILRRHLRSRPPAS
ncbi:MAG: BlaI/MecI/CopY family transcriptional regulator [Acidimicrobiales bacterium]|nr:BlaI/MecI/CopY family transcriptional regulator [Acidimicrobiales bacterium]